MTKQSRSLLIASVAASLLVFGGVFDPAAAQTPAAQEALSDERVMELARGYVELLQSGEYERLWEHLAPEAQQRFGTLEQFRTASAGVMTRLGTEAALVRETVEPARAGMIAHKLYHRVSRYTGADGTPVRLTIGLVNDGSIGGLTARPVQ